MNLKHRHAFLVFGIAMFAMFMDSFFQVFAKPVSVEMQLVTGAFAAIGIMLYTIELHAEQTRNRFEAIEEALADE